MQSNRMSYLKGERLPEMSFAFCILDGVLLINSHGSATMSRGPIFLKIRRSKIEARQKEPALSHAAAHFKYEMGPPCPNSGDASSAPADDDDDDSNHGWRVADLTVARRLGS